MHKRMIIKDHHLRVGAQITQRKIYKWINNLQNTVEGNNLTLSNLILESRVRVTKMLIKDNNNSQIKEIETWMFKTMGSMTKI